MKKGLVHIYTGDGKGKTTAAVGLLVRACGCGLRACMLQFLKTGESGELVSLQKLNVPVFRLETVRGFYFQLGEEEKQLLTREVASEFELARRLVREYDIVVLDEVFGVLANGLLTVSDLICLVREKPAETELVLTGRDAPDELVGLADYVSEIRMRKHPYTGGMTARRGIEY